MGVRGCFSGYCLRKCNGLAYQCLTKVPLSKQYLSFWTCGITLDNWLLRRIFSMRQVEWKTVICCTFKAPSACTIWFQSRLQESGSFLLIMSVGKTAFKNSWESLVMSLVFVGCAATSWARLYSLRTRASLT